MGNDIAFILVIRNNTEERTELGRNRWEYLGDPAGKKEMTGKDKAIELQGSGYTALSVTSLNWALDRGG